MKKNIYDRNLKLNTPTLLIKRKDYVNIGAIKASDIIYKNNFNSPNELSFTVHKNNTEDFLWDNINDYNVICIPEYFDMQVKLNEENELTKQVTCVALGEAELSQINLHDIEINTDADIARPDYDENFPTIFYRNPEEYGDYDEIWNAKENYEKYIVKDKNGNISMADTVEKKKDILRKSSLLHRILEKASHYSIGHIDDSLKKLKNWYQFSISDTNIYDELTRDIAEQYKCLFVFDSKTRTVNTYDLCNTCRSCGYRGEFSDKCPECGEEKKFDGAFGKDTSIFISKDNLSTSASIESNKDSLKNCFYVSGGDDMITDSVRSINPNGSNYIYYFSPETKKSMPQELVDRIEEYTSEYNYSYNEKVFPLDESIVNDYNDVINYINNLFSKKDENGNIIENKYDLIPSNIIGYKNIVKTIYDVIDIYLFLKSSAFPTIITENETLQDSLNKLNVTNLSPIGVNDIKTVVLSSIDRAVENYCKVFINTALYKISTEDTEFTYIDGNESGTWTGTIKLTEIADAENSGSITLTLKVNSDLENFLKQKLEKALAKIDDYAKPIIDIDLEEKVFVEKLHLYNADYLISLEQSFNGCLTIISETAKSNQDLYDEFWGMYKKRLDYITAENAYRNDQIEIVSTINDLLTKIQSDERVNLDFQSYIGEDLWKIFCSYRREDSYQNDNYISDDLTNSEIIEKTEELLDAAKKELYKAGNMQFDVSADLNNLLALPEFKLLTDDFEVGNWIHLMIDEQVYPLRLLSYEIHFDDLTTILVEFSTLVKTYDGTSDFKSVIDSATSIASSYSSFKQQMKNNTSATKYVDDWIQSGLDATNTKLVNDNLTQDIVIDSNGILCRAYDDIEDGYDKHQIKINRNAVYLTNDAWNSIYSAIGKYYYTDPVTKEKKIAYGVNAETIVGKFILGENLGIYNNENNSSLSFDTNGLKVTNGENTVSINPNDTYLFKVTNEGTKTDTLSIDEDGYIIMLGSIEAKQTKYTEDGKSYDVIGNFGSGGMDLFNTNNDEEFVALNFGGLYIEKSDILDSNIFHKIRYKNTGYLVNTVNKNSGKTVVGYSYLGDDGFLRLYGSNGVEIGGDIVVLGASSLQIVNSDTISTGILEAKKLKIGNEEIEVKALKQKIDDLEQRLERLERMMA